MNSAAPGPLAIELAQRIHNAREELTAEWLVRIAERVKLVPNRVFPSSDLLDHVPLLLAGIASFLADPAESVAADTPVLVHAMELGALRYSQGFDEGEILKEFQILGDMLLAFIAHEADSIDAPCTRSELLFCAHRVHHAVSVIHMAAVTEFLQLLRRRLSEREERLHAFNRAMTHEFRNKISAAEGAAQLIDLPDLSSSEVERMRKILRRNLGSMRTMIENLVELSIFDRGQEPRRSVRLPAAAAEAAQLLEDAAREKEVSITVDPSLPDIEVSSAVTLVLANLLGNAIKYSDGKLVDRRVDVRAKLTVLDGNAEAVIIDVQDNGVGVPPDERKRIFERYYRASGTADQVEGSGLGLTIVQDVVTSLGGNV
ncbi:MAG: sensor histidine kinase, partial [Gemmatimonadaceae bacterium]